MMALFVFSFLALWILASEAAERRLSDEKTDRLLHIFGLE